MPAVGVISPIKDEVDNLPALVDSVVGQTVRPERWVIVDDGSSDGSTGVIEQAASTHSWIRHVRKTDAEEYDIGVNYARVLQTGFTALVDEFGDNLDYYMVLDGDMELSDDYLAAVTSYMDAHNDVVIACASVYTRHDGDLTFEHRARKHPFGGATLYDGDFYRLIGGPSSTPCVDSVTKAKARMRGYRPRYVTELDARAIQARPPHETGQTSESAAALGRDNYAIGYPPIAATAKGARFVAKESIQAGLFYVRGYFSAWIRGDPRAVDDEVVRYYYREKHRDVVRSLCSRIAGTLPG